MHLREMKTHAPATYACPFCNIAAGGEEQGPIVWRDEISIAFLSLHQQAKNHGSLLVCPVEHFENIYVLPENLGASLFGATQQLAVAMKHALGCEGVTVRQHNEPAGGQDVWHYHVHVVPRFAGDNHYNEPASVMPVEQRVIYAERIRQRLAESAA